MTFHGLGLYVLFAYLAVLVVVAFLARRSRQDHGVADHFLASRSLGTFVLFLTFYATAYSGNSLLGYPGAAYRRGFVWIMSVGFMLSIIVMFHSLVPRLRPLAMRYAFVTPGDYLRFRFSKTKSGYYLAYGISILMALALANFLLAQLKAMGIVVEEVSGGVIPAWGGIIGLAAFILFYENTGGMRAVAWTDAAQGALMLVGLAAMLHWIVGDSGGLQALTQAVAEVRPAAVTRPDALTCANWASSVVLMGLASVVYPQAIQRVYAASSGKVLTRSLALMSLMPLCTTLVVAFIGIYAIPRFAAMEGIVTDSVMPRMLESWAASGNVGLVFSLLVFVGALAAIMSTADSVLLSLGSILALDLFGKIRTTRILLVLASMPRSW